MSILIDTHVWLWWLTEPAKLNRDALAALSDDGADLFVSTASVWEIVVKHAIGKLKLPSPPSVLLPTALAHYRVTTLPITSSHALQVASLPMLHRDPFDRVIIAQAQFERLPILTADRALAQYDVETRFAGRKPAES